MITERMALQLFGTTDVVGKEYQSNFFPTKVDVYKRQPIPCPLGLVEKKGLNSLVSTSLLIPAPVSAISNIVGDTEVRIKISPCLLYTSRCV